jgi:hypothetical protein
LFASKEWHGAGVDQVRHDWAFVGEEGLLLVCGLHDGLRSTKPGALDLMKRSSKLFSAKTIEVAAPKVSQTHQSVDEVGTCLNGNIAAMSVYRVRLE